MTIEDKLKNLIVARYDNVSAFTKAVHIPNSTFASIMTRGILNANVSSIAKICSALHISMDALVGGQIISTADMPARNPSDIKEKVDAICTDLQTRSDLSLNGQPLSPSRAEDLADLFQLSLEHIQNRQ